ncbi:dTDP-L-rhamnose 4-epimerase [Kribbella amoyensis]|uniref:dTDP-L-rhamnose 4-epimerase n=1 Tax=Kribbella amoyensis TaxID=996641 RepID=A0A561C0B0_9ACTN|nr:NAD-dependent epimerase/dehydratase family protein [Kribbella amoyensis]TWD84540.1 dTDP-L-rhamnose 4-epimerase [Kribbella amoyensis]
MKVLLTGGAGFIGRHVHHQLLADGHEVVVLDSLRADVHGQPPDVENLVVADVRDADAVATALRGVDAVVHLASKVGLGVSLDDIDDYVSSNSLGTAVLLRQLGRLGVGRLVYASSMVVYGEGRYRCHRHGEIAPGPRRVEDLRDGLFEPPCPVCGEFLVPGLVEESARPDPRNAYAVSKLSGEQLAAGWARETGGQVAALRFHNVYGPGMPRNTPYAGVAALFRSGLERGLAPQVFEDGQQRRDFVEVRDIATAVALAVEAEHAEFTAYNVGSGTVHTIGDLASELSRAYGGPAPEITGRFRLGDVRHVTADSGRIKAELGWKPAYDLRDGVAALVRS